MLAHRRRQNLRRHIAVHAVLYQTNTANLQINLIRNHLRTTVASRAHNASPVRILTEESSFNQRRLRNRHSRSLRIIPGSSTNYIHLKELSRALTIMRNHLRQISSTGHQRFEKRRIIGMLLTQNNLIFSKAISQHNHAVVSGSITIHHNHIKGLVRSLLHRTLQHIRSNGCIRSDKGQHSCHIRMNHASALGNTRKFNSLTTDDSLISSTLNKSISSLNSHRTAFALALVQAIHRISNAGQQLIHGQKLSNNTSGAHKNLLRLNTQ